MYKDGPLLQLARRALSAALPLARRISAVLQRAFPLARLEKGLASKPAGDGGPQLPLEEASRPPRRIIDKLGNEGTAFRDQQ